MDLVLEDSHWFLKVVIVRQIKKYYIINYYIKSNIGPIPLLLPPPIPSSKSVLVLTEEFGFTCQRGNFIRGGYFYMEIFLLVACVLDHIPTHSFLF